MRGDVVSQRGAGCLCQGDKDVAATFHGTLLGNHFEIPLKPSHGALCQEPRPAEQRWRVCRSHFGARLLSWPLHFRRGLMCSGALELGSLQGEGEAWTGWAVLPPMASRETGPHLELLF